MVVPNANDTTAYPNEPAVEAAVANVSSACGSHWSRRILACLPIGDRSKRRSAVKQGHSHSIASTT